MQATAGVSDSAFVDYFLAGCKPRSEFRVGMEIEHMCIRKTDGERIPYAGDRASVVGILEGLLAARGGMPMEVDGQLVGISADWGQVSLEPGGQIEWSSPPCRELSQLLEVQHAWLRCFHEQLECRQIRSIEKGFDSGCRNSDIPWVPKERYRLMREHYAPHTELAHAAMGRTAGIHVSLDYSDAEDWRRKFRAMLLLTPVTIALFANSDWWRESSGVAAVRPAMWLGLDPERCQLPHNAFHPDFSLADWASWVANVSRMLTLRDGQLAEAQEQPFCQTGMRPETHPEQWQLHLSTIFAPVRTSQRLEVRTIDLQTDRLLPSTAAFWYGLLYSERCLDELLKMLTEIPDAAVWHKLFEAACRDGMRDNGTLQRLAKRSLELSVQGLQESPHDQTLGLVSLEQLTRHAGF